MIILVVNKVSESDRRENNITTVLNG